MIEHANKLLVEKLNYLSLFNFEKNKKNAVKDIIQMKVSKTCCDCC